MAGRRANLGAIFKSVAALKVFEVAAALKGLSLVDDNRRRGGRRAQGGRRRKGRPGVIAKSVPNRTLSGVKGTDAIRPHPMKACHGAIFKVL